MWVLLALLSALFAGVTAVLAKIGIRRTDSNLVTALRTVIVVIFAWLLVLLTGSWHTIPSLELRSVVFLILSGLATGASWLCYFRALQTGDVNRVVPIDKSSTVLTMLMAALLLGEPVTWLGVLAMVFISVGTWLMLDRQPIENQVAGGENRWLPYALLSALFASLTAVLGKFGISGVDSDLGMAIRTLVVLIMAWGIVLSQGTWREIPDLERRGLVFIGLSGCTTGLSWICYYRALQQGPASVVVPLDKLSILVTVLFGYLLLGERLSRKSILGLALLVAGTLSLLIEL